MKWSLHHPVLVTRIKIQNVYPPVQLPSVQDSSLVSEAGNDCREKGMDTKVPEHKNASL
jgi:hypothetical protein